MSQCAIVGICSHHKVLIVLNSVSIKSILSTTNVLTKCRVLSNPSLLRIRLMSVPSNDLFRFPSPIKGMHAFLLPHVWEIPFVLRLKSWEILSHKVYVWRILFSLRFIVSWWGEHIHIKIVVKCPSPPRCPYCFFVLYLHMKYSKEDELFLFYVHQNSILNRFILKTSFLCLLSFTLFFLFFWFIGFASGWFLWLLILILFRLFWTYIWSIQWELSILVKYCVIMW